MNNLPTIEEFLDVIDEQRSIDRKEVFANMSFVVFMSSVKRASELLSDEQKTELFKLTHNPTENIEEIFRIFRDSGKTGDLIEITKTASQEINMDYIKTQLENLPLSEKTKVFEKFPSLKDL